MLPTNRIEGKSLPLNIVAILLNLAGLYLITYDFLYELDLTNTIIGYVLFFLGLVAIVFLVVLKNFISMLHGLIALILLSIIMGISILIYQKNRHQVKNKNLLK